MKVLKKVEDPLFNNRRKIIDNYLLVEDDFVFDDMVYEDVTSFDTLNAFFSVGRLNHNIFRKSLKTNVLPKFNELPNEEKEKLLFIRVKPIDITDEDIISIVGEEGLTYINNTKTEFELIEELQSQVSELDLEDVNERLSTVKVKVSEINSVISETDFSELQSIISDIDLTEINNNISNLSSVLLLTQEDVSQIPDIDSIISEVSSLFSTTTVIQSQIDSIESLDIETKISNLEDLYSDISGVITDIDVEPINSKISEISSLLTETASETNIIGSIIESEFTRYDSEINNLSIQINLANNNYDTVASEISELDLESVTGLVSDVNLSINSIISNIDTFESELTNDIGSIISNISEVSTLISNNESTISDITSNLLNVESSVSNNSSNISELTILSSQNSEILSSVIEDLGSFENLVNSEIQRLDDEKFDKTGGVITGDVAIETGLIVDGNTEMNSVDTSEIIIDEGLAKYKDDFHLDYDERTLVDREYVDTLNNLKVNRSGDTITGDLVINEANLRVLADNGDNILFINSEDRVAYINTDALTGVVPNDDLSLFTGGKVAFGDSVTVGRLRGNTPGSVPRILSLIDTNSTVRVWRFSDATNADPAVEFVWGTAGTPSGEGNAWWDMYLDGDTPPNDSFAIRRRTDGNVEKLRLTTNTAIIPMTTSSTSPTTGALTVAGGVGISGATNLAGLARYSTNLSTSYDNRTLVDKEYVDTLPLTTYNTISAGATSTTSTAYTLQTGMQITNVPAGTYLVGYGNWLSHNSTNAEITTQIYVGGTAQTGSEMLWRRGGNQGNTNGLITYNNFVITLTSTQTVEIRWRTNTGTATSNNRYFTLLKVSSIR